LLTSRIKVSERTSRNRFGNYEIVSLLGSGGMAKVYRARVISGPRAGWFVALKRLAPLLAHNPEYLDQFTSEAELSKLLDHPHIVKVLEVGVHHDIYYIVMELVEGRDLGQILRRCKKRRIYLPVDFAVYLVRVLLEALEYAHSASLSGKPLEIVHCDVSPSNLFISRNGEVKLGDFGIARARSVRSNDAVLGKPFYLSPEGVEGQINLSADLWAANVTLYELLSLERPFAGETEQQMLEAIRRRSYRPVRELRPEVPPKLAQLIDRAFSSKVADRFHSAADFGSALAEHYDERVGTPLAIAALVRGLFKSAAKAGLAGGA
jgi:serine/threonine-protein kinase